MSEIICARCAQECTADVPPCGCGEHSTLMQPMCTRCWADRDRLAADLARAQVILDRVSGALHDAGTAVPDDLEAAIRALIKERGAAVADLARERERVTALRYVAQCNACPSCRSIANAALSPPGDGATKERLYYVQDKRSYVGNCALLWAKNACGYVCDPAEAHVYTESEIKSQSWRETDIPLLKDEVDRACVHHLRVDTGAFKRVKELSRAALSPPPGDAPSVTRPWLQYEREIVAYLFERIERWTADGRKPAQTYFTSGLEREVARMIESAIEPPPGDAKVTDRLSVGCDKCGRRTTDPAHCPDCRVTYCGRCSDEWQCPKCGRAVLLGPPGDAMPPRPPPTTIPSNGVPRQDRARGKENG